MSPQLLQLIVVLAPLVGSVILTPLLVAILNRAKAKAEAENIEVSSDKIRFDTMDVLIGHMREQIGTLKTDLAGERAVAEECRVQRRLCEAEKDTVQREKDANERASADALRWGIALYDQLNHMGASPVRPPTRVLALVEDLDVDSTKTLPHRRNPGITG